jgi:hypothetical protein
MSAPSIGRVLAVFVATAAVVVGGGSAAWALSHHQNDGPRVPTYVSAAAMADKADCARSFHSVPPPASVQSAGWCVVDGSQVDFRVQRDINTANPWPTTRGKHELTCVGAGWLYRTASPGAYRKISAAIQGG